MNNLTRAISSLYPTAQWVMINDDYNQLDWQSANIPKPTEEELIAECNRLQEQDKLNACKATAQKLIAESDWAMLPDVNITNKSEFEAYRATLRNLILNPVVNPDFPVEPQPIWQ